MLTIHVNGEARDVDVDGSTPLLWVLREQLGLTGTHYGCGIAQCGACTVHLGGRAVRSCILPVGSLGDAAITTIEGLGPHPCQAAWIKEQVPQCGYCQSGQIMAAASLLSTIPNPTDEDIGREMTNICRCATYDRIRRAIHAAAAEMPPVPEEVVTLPTETTP
jgi:isoquinoline 1-oxidoreductase alpha subunit